MVMSEKGQKKHHLGDHKETEKKVRGEQGEWSDKEER
jgi:hypothetical protein